MVKFEKITSRENATIKQVITLISSSKKRRESGLFVLEGLRLSTDAYISGYRFETLFLSETAQAKNKQEAEKLSAVSNKTYLLPDSLFEKISDTVNPQGFLAVCKISQTLSSLNKSGKYIALENLSDPSNLGAISRTAEAFGFDGIVLSADSCDPYAPKSLRASMGALLRIPLMVTDDIIATAEMFGIKTYSAVISEKAEPLNKVNFEKGSMVIIGNEANGIRPQTADKSYKLITIPMSGKAESLNAATAASIIMWEMCRNL